MTDTSARQRLTIGFVGLGNMGWPMARNLHAAGCALIVRDPATENRFAAEHQGVTVAQTPAAFAVADIVVTMLPNGTVVHDALLRDDGGIGPALPPGALVIEMSSSDPSDTLRLAAELESFAVNVVDAPVSGGVSRAITGEPR